MIKKEHLALVGSAIAAFCFWVIDTALDYFPHHNEPFPSVSLFSGRELAFRLLFSICFLAFGTFTFRLLRKQRRSEMALLKEIEERKLKEENLYALSVKDELTGLYNRRGFFTLVEQQFKLADRLKRGIFILYADLDNMKTINDTFGHQEGDRALVDTARILKDTFRESDIIARIGGDEFVVIPVGTGGETIEIITTRIDKNIEVYNSERKQRPNLSLSFGIVCYNPASPCTIDELIAQGDKLMYEKKRHKFSRRSSLSNSLFTF